MTPSEEASAALTKRESARDKSKDPARRVTWDRNPESTANTSDGTQRMLTAAAALPVTRRPVPCRSGMAATTSGTAAIAAARLCMSESGVPEGRATCTW